MTRGRRGLVKGSLLVEVALVVVILGVLALIAVTALYGARKAQDQSSTDSTLAVRASTGMRRSRTPPWGSCLNRSIRWR